MNPIAELLVVDSVVARLETSSKKRLLEHVGELVQRLHGIPRQEVFDGLASRERLGSTGLGLGVAIPHARIKGLEQVIGAFLSLRTPLDFDAPDGKPVELVFALLVPEVATERHLELLALLAEMFSADEFRARLAAAADADALRAAFAAWPD